MKINKKLQKALPLLLVFSAFLVSAAVLTYYAQINVDINVDNPIDVTGDGEQIIDCKLDVGEGVTSCPGNEIIISNSGESKGKISIIGSELDEGIAVRYWSELILTKKIVDFTKDVWEIPEDADKVNVKYTIIGEGFQASTELISDPLYTLIYYADSELRFANPEEAILGIEENLPLITDANAEGYVGEGYDYCETGEYNTCHGAKIWYVPRNAINIEDNTLDWSRAEEFYFETELIQYNKEGNIIIYPGSIISFTPEYLVDNKMPDGSYSQIITVA